MEPLDEHPTIKVIKQKHIILADRVRELEGLVDVWSSPWWKLALFVIDGWPLRRVVERPQWRPWRRWWTS